MDSSQEACEEGLALPTWLWALECDPSWPGPPAGSKSTGTGLRAKTWPVLSLSQLTMDRPQSPPGPTLSSRPLQTHIFGLTDPSQKCLRKGILVPGLRVEMRYSHFLGSEMEATWQVPDVGPSWLEGQDPTGPVCGAAGPLEVYPRAR